MLAGSETLQHVARGDAIFREGEEPRGVWVLHSGEVDLVFAARTGYGKPLRLAEAGQILGLSCVVTHRPFDCTAVARTECEVGYIDRDELLRTLDDSPAVWFTVLQMLSSDVNAVYEDIRVLATR